jgi:hypothetical protein
MTDQNVCPYCGGNKLEAERYDRYNNKKIPHQPNVGHRGKCNDCGRDGPWIQAEDDNGHWYYAGWLEAEQAAIHAFCHPAHLLKDKALVDIDDLTEVLSILEDANNPAIDRLWAQMREGRVK